jgi:uncharacterized protein (DUF885 family)
MYEGWAVYCEQMMTEQEFISKKSENFIMLRDRLWRALRVQLDVDLHCNGLSYDSAVERMVDELGFTKEASELDINWYIEYPTVPAGYAVGWKMINLLREYEEDRLGNSFDLKNFHDNLISKGSIGLPLVIESTFGKEALTHVNREFRNYIK